MAVLGDHRWPVHGSLWTQRPTPGLVHNVRGLAYLVGRTRCKPEAGVTSEAQGPRMGRGVICSYRPHSWGVQPPASCSWALCSGTLKPGLSPNVPLIWGHLSSHCLVVRHPSCRHARVGRAPLHLTSGVTVGAGRTAPTGYYLGDKRQHRNRWPKAGDHVPPGAGPRRSAFACKYTETHVF